VPLADTAPAIFTLNSTAAARAPFSTRIPLSHAAEPGRRGLDDSDLPDRGRTHRPLEVSGQVTMINTSASGPLTPAPVLPVSVLIGGQPRAPWTSPAEAPFRRGPASCR